MEFSCFCTYKCFTLCKCPDNYDVKNNTYNKCRKTPDEMLECPFYRPVGEVKDKKILNQANKP